MKKHIALLLVAAGLAGGHTVQAADGIAVEAGRGNSTDIGRISLVRQWDRQWDRQWFTDGDWFLGGYWEASVGRWKSDAAGGNTIWDIGFTPVFRLQPKAESGLRPYLEGAVGAHYITETQVNASRDMGSHIQFGSHLGLGLVFGDKGRFDLGYRYQHVSNADLESPNPGINFQQVRFAYLF